MIYRIEAFLASGQKAISMSGVTTFITCQAINLWGSEVMVELFFYENQK